MDKKEIYEHLAKIYLDASAKKNKKVKKYPRYLKNIVLITIPLASVLLIVSGAFHSPKSNKGPYSSETALVILPSLTKINFNFNPAKKEIFTVDLNKLDLIKFKTLGFALRKENSRDNISLRIEFCSGFNESSALYVTNIPPRWLDYRINFSEFTKISDWSKMAKLTFTVEEWNTK